MTDMDELKKRLSYSDIESSQIGLHRRQSSKRIDRPTSFISSLIISDNQEGSSVQRNDSNILDEIDYIE